MVHWCFPKLYTKYPIILALVLIILSGVLLIYFESQPKPSPSLESYSNSTDQSHRNATTREQSVSLDDSRSAGQTSVKQNYARLPLTFEANQGQADSRVKFLSRGNGHNLFLTPTEAVLTLQHATAETHSKNSFRSRKRATGSKGDRRQAVLRMKLVGANPAAEVKGQDELRGKKNYFIGSDPQKWCTNIPTYAKVMFSEIYPGVDLAFHGNQQQLEYDFVIAPGSDPGIIRLFFEGAKEMHVSKGGDLILRVAEGEVVQHKPVVYQEVDGIRNVISGRYVLTGKNRVGFEIANYDVTRPLTVDPILSYSTYLGGSGDDYVGGMAVDNSGNVYVTGQTLSSDFPVKSPYQSGSRGYYDAFVTKLSADGSQLIYSTYIGGSEEDRGFILAVDNSGNAHVTGRTYSDDFPTASPFQATRGRSFTSDAFVTKLDADGSVLLYSTFLGGSSQDYGMGIAVDSSGNAYVTGATSSLDFPTASAFQAVKRGFLSSDAFVTKFNAAGSAVIYSTYLGGTDDDYGLGISIDSLNNAYVTGQTSSIDFPTKVPFQPDIGGGNTDAFIAKFNATGSSLLYSTYLGGNSSDEGHGVAVDSSGSAFVTGSTSSGNFPVTLEAFQTSYGGGDWDAFVAKINNIGSLSYSSFIGGEGADQLYCTADCVAVDVSGNAYIVGRTDSLDFPTINPLQETNAGGLDVFVTGINPTGSSIIYSTYLGGSSDDDGWGIALDHTGAIYVAGGTNSTSANFSPIPFPATLGAFQTADSGGTAGFVAKIEPSVCSFDCAATVPQTGNVSTPVSFSATTTQTGCVSPIRLVMKKSPVWTGDQVGPQDTAGHFWNHSVFDDSQWSTVTLPDDGFDFDPDDRYYRFHFTWDGVSPVSIYFATDDGLAMYVNGNPLGSWGNGWRQEGCVNNTTTSCNINFSVPAQVIPPGILQLGDNVLAVDLWNGVGLNFYLDVKLGGVQPAATYDWDFGDGSVHSTQQSPRHSYGVAGTYTWKMTASINGAPSCVKTGTILVTTLPGCTLNCTVTVPTKGTTETAISFAAVATASGCTGSPTYEWDFGDGSGHSTQQNSTHTYAAAGNYIWNMTASLGGAGLCVKTGMITVSHTPVLFIPGIYGTELHKGTDTLWLDIDTALTSLTDSFLDPLELKQDLTPSDPGITTGPVIRFIQPTLAPRATFTFHYTDKLIKEFTDRGYLEGQDFFTFPYDWRFSVSEGAIALKNRINEILDQTGATKINIIAHSTGGLITKKYVSENSDHKLHKVVFVGVPNLGAPKAINVLLTGDTGITSLGGVGNIEMKKLAQNLPIAYDLSPSANYYSLKGSFFSIVQLNLFSETIENLDYLSTKAHLISTHGLNNQAFNNATALHAVEFDNFDLSTRGIDLWNIVGCKAGTIGRVIETVDIFGSIAYSVEEEAPGDGTVPLESATHLPILSNHKFYALKASHGEMPSQDAIRQQIYMIIADDSPTVPYDSTITQDIGKCKLKGQVISVYSPIDIMITDQDGRYAGPLDDGSIVNDIPNADYIALGEHKTVYLPDDDGQAYTIKLRGTGDGAFTVKVETIDDSNTTGVQIFPNVPVSPQLAGSIVSDNAQVQLQLDLNGDGTVDQVLSPPVVLTQEQLDRRRGQGSGTVTLIPPQASPPAGSYPSAEPISLSGADWDMIYYTTDGTDPAFGRGQLYTTPVVISNSTTIKCIGCRAEGFCSNVISLPYKINPIQLSATSFSVNEGEGSVSIAVIRPGDSSDAASIDYQTNDNFTFVECDVKGGVANQRCDYIGSAGTLNFAMGETSKTFTVPIIDDFQVEGNETLNLSLSNPVGGTLGSQNTAVVTISDNDTTPPATRLFVAQLTGAQETPPPGNTSAATGLGTLLLSSDEMSAQVNLSFSGLSSTQTAAHIHGPAHMEVPGPVVFPLLTGAVNNQTINLTPTQVAQLKGGLFYFNVHTNNFPNGEIRGQILPNPLENARFFVRQQYYDFQNREPDQGGFDYWTNDQITSCGADLACITARRTRVADAFFFEPEFQQTGSYVFRLYRAAFGNTQPRANPQVPQLPSYAAFIQDRATVVGGADLAQKQLVLANAFAQRPEFLARYPLGSSGPQFVDALLATILSDSSANLSSQRDLLIAHFNNGGRGLVLFHLANDYWNTCHSAPCVPSGFGSAVDNRPFLDAEYNRGFVATMYFGFLRRDADIGGYVFWLGQVGSFPLRSPVGQHKMVCGALITSQEYQQRFNTYFIRSDAECTAIN